MLSWPSKRPPDRSGVRHIVRDPAGRPAAAPSANVAADSIKCWWKTDKDAVLIGEQFTLTLTCGVVENSRTKVAADAKQFEPTALSLAPFEVLGGTPHEDIQDSALAILPARIPDAAPRRDVLRSGRRHPRAEDHVRHAFGDQRRSRRPGSGDCAPRVADARPIARLEERTRTSATGRPRRSATSRPGSHKRQAR